MGALIVILVASFLVLFDVFGGAKKRTLAESVPGDIHIPESRDRTIFVTEIPVILSGGSSIISVHSFTKTMELDNIVVALPDTQFAGEYKNKNLFYAPCGMEIKTGFPGLVVGTGCPEKYNDGKGGYVSIQNAHTMKAITYSHLSEVHVEPGDFLEKGVVLGTAGLSGGFILRGACQIGVTNQ